MKNSVNAKVGCTLVGGYVDEAECPTNLAYHKGDVVRPQVIARYLDVWAGDDGIKTSKKEEPENDTPGPD
jgi:hypothetical protein